MLSGVVCLFCWGDAVIEYHAHILRLKLLDISVGIKRRESCSFKKKREKRKLNFTSAVQHRVEDDCITSTCMNPLFPFFSKSNEFIIHCAAFFIPFLKGKPFLYHIIPNETIRK